MNLNIIFTWWNKHTFGTFLKTLFFGKFVGQDDLGNKYYTNKQDERWVIYSESVEATKLPSDWFLWMHHTIAKIPTQSDEKYIWQKKHAANKTGSKEAFRPTKIKKNAIIEKYDAWK